MAIFAPPPPAAVLETLHRDLRRLASNSSSLVPPTRLTIASGLAIYQTGPASPGQGDVLGWRFVVLHEKGAFWVDVSEGTGTSVFDGPAVGALLRAGELLDAAGLDGEVGVLTSPIVAGGALWVRADTDGCVRFSPELGEIVEGREAVIEKWRARAAELIRQSEDVIE